MCSPMRTRIAPAASPSRAARAAAAAPPAVGKAMKNASPCVSTSTPPCAAAASRTIRRCSASASAYRAGPSSCSRRVEPSMSVKSSVTVPCGSARTGRMMTTRGAAAEPARAPGRAELGLLGRELLGRADDGRRRRRAAEEVGLDLRDAPAAELDEAVALALVAPPERLAAEPRDDVVGDDAGRVLREHAGLRHRDAHARRPRRTRPGTAS